MVFCCTIHSNSIYLQKPHEKLTKIVKKDLKKSECMVEQETYELVFYIYVMISGHPWEPWPRLNNSYHMIEKDRGSISHSGWTQHLCSSVNLILTWAIFNCHERREVFFLLFASSNSEGSQVTNSLDSNPNCISQYWRIRRMH